MTDEELIEAISLRVRRACLAHEDHARPKAFSDRVILANEIANEAAADIVSQAAERLRALSTPASEDQREKIARAVQKECSTLYRGTLLDLGRRWPDDDLPDTAAEWFIADAILALSTPGEREEGSRAAQSQPSGEASADAEVFAGLDAEPSVAIERLQAIRAAYPQGHFGDDAGRLMVKVRAADVDAVLVGIRNYELTMKVIAKTPCGECHLNDGEVCDICGAPASPHHGQVQALEAPETLSSPQGGWVLANEEDLDVLCKRLAECAEIAGNSSVGKITASYMALAMLSARQQIEALRERIASPNPPSVEAATSGVEGWRP